MEVTVEPSHNTNTFFFLFSDPEIQTTQAGRGAAGTAEGKNEGDHPIYKQCPITVPPVGIKRTPTPERQNTRGEIITDRCSRAMAGGSPTQMIV